MRLIGAALAGLLLVLACGACGGGGASDPTPSSSAPVDSVEAFSSFSGLTIPPQASGVSVRATVSTEGEPEYHVRFSLPTSALDAFCADGDLDRPLHVVTIPQDYRDAFDYQGDGTSGVQITEGGLPGDQQVQRQLLATGTRSATADVQVYAYRIPR